MQLIFAALYRSIKRSTDFGSVSELNADLKEIIIKTSKGRV